MKTTILVGLFLCLSAAAVSALADDENQNKTVLEFNTMAPVTGAFVGSTNPVRGVPGGGLPWVIGSAEGELHRNGKIEVRVRGLVLANTHANPIPTFRAIVSCLINSMGGVTMVNVSTNTFPADASGNSIIEDKVSLPNSCVAPIVFVTSPGGAWFAATGF